MSATRLPYRPRMSQAGLAPTESVIATDESGQQRQVSIAGENPLTLLVDGKEIVTLMTLGREPELLALGYLRTQRFIDRIEEVRSVEVDWDRESVRIETFNGIDDWESKLARKVVTTGCGQGTVFSCTLDKLYDHRLQAPMIRQSTVYRLLANLAQSNEIYRSAGAVHGCALCRDEQALCFIEDVGRHNAADAIAGRMWLERQQGGDKIFYTTGRLTSEIVMKVALMGIPVLLSRSGVTQMGLELAADLGVTMIARAKGRHFLVFNGADRVIFDASEPHASLGRAAGE